MTTVRATRIACGVAILGALGLATSLQAQAGIGKATFSADGKTITIENDYTATAAGQPVGKQTNIWVRK